MDPTSRIVCCADETAVAEAVASVLRDLVPAVPSEATSWNMPGDVDGIACLVAIVGGPGEKALDGVLAWRARGYECPIVVIADDVSTVDRDALSAAGVQALIDRSDIAVGLLPALESALDERTQFTALHQRLHHLRALLAAGRLAARLPHRLNNPLAALLGEAELLTLEPLSDDQRESIARIIELGRRIVSEVKVLDGVMGDTPRA